MIENYILEILKFILSKINHDLWLYRYIRHIYKGIIKYKKEKKLFLYNYLEQDPTFIYYFLEFKIKQIQNLNNLELKEKSNYFLIYLKENLKNQETLNLINNMFNKNHNKYYNSYWFVPIYKYQKTDLINFIENIDEIKFKNYLFFIESIDTLIKEQINIFDPNSSMIPLSIFHNLLIKICLYSDIIIDISQINKHKFIFLSKFIN